MARILFSIPAFAASVALAAAAADAAPGTWITDGNGDWSSDTNWAGSIVADGADNLADFSTIDITANRTVTLDGDRTIGSLAFGDTSGGASWRLLNSTLTLQTTVGTPQIAVGTNSRISSNLAGNQGFTKTGGSVLTLDGNNAGLSGTVAITGGRIELTSTSAVGNVDFDIAGGSRLDIAQAGLYDIAGTVSGNGTVRNGNGSGIVSFQQANPGFTGKVLIQDGTLQINNTGASGLGTAELEAGFNMRIRSSDDTARVIGNALDFNNTNGSIRLGGGPGNSGDLTFTFTGNAIGVGNSGAIRVEDGVTATIFANFNQRAIRKFDPGTLVLEGNSTTSNPTLVGNNGGTLIVNGSLNNSDVTVLRSVLGGDGSVKSVLVRAEGTLAPGHTVGTFTVNEGATFDPGGTLQIELDGSTSDKLNVVGNLNLGGSAVLDVLGIADGVTNYIIASYGSLSGTFDSPLLPAGYVIDYAFDDGLSSNNIALVIPEPSSLMLAAAGLTGLGVRRRRNR